MGFRIVSFGELVWDSLPGKDLLGGAAANFALHCAALGAEAKLVTAVGDDPSGRRIIQELVNRHLPVDHVQITPLAPTGLVTVRVSPEGNPTYEIHHPSSWDFIEANDAVLRCASGADAICFGTLVQRGIVSKASLYTVLEKAGPQCLKIFDVNLRQDILSVAILRLGVSIASVLKINSDELRVLSEMFDLKGNDRERVRELASRFSLRCVALTRGEAGSFLLLDGDESDHPGFPVKMVDAIGAGDAFTAALAIGILKGKNAQEINEAANKVASFVASQPGATPLLPTEVASLYGERSP